MNRCASCPLADQGVECEGERSAPFCASVRAGRRGFTGLAHRLARPRTSAAEVLAATPPSPLKPVVNLRKVASKRAECGQFARPDCGCLPGLCKAGRGDPKYGVSAEDCERCMPPEKLIFRTKQSPGDLLVSLAAVQSLHERYPGKYLTDMRGCAPAIWEGLPWVTGIADGHGRELLLDNVAIGRSKATPYHVIDSYCQSIEHTLGLPLRATTNKPPLALTAEELAKPPLVLGPYWVVNAGFKTCFPTKAWGHYQRLVDLLRGSVRFVQIGELSPNHVHQQLRNVIDLRGKTSTRELIRLVYHAVGVVSPVTFVYWIASAFDKPAVVVDSAREPLSWYQTPTAVPLARYNLHPCSAGGCWKTHLEHANPLKVCSRQVTTDGRTVPECLDKLEPERVAEVILGLSRLKSASP